MVVESWWLVANVQWLCCGNRVGLQYGPVWWEWSGDYDDCGESWGGVLGEICEKVGEVKMCGEIGVG